MYPIGEKSEIIKLTLPDGNIFLSAFTGGELNTIPTLGYISDQMGNVGVSFKLE